MGGGDGLRERVERTGVDVAGLEAHDRRPPVARLEGGRQRGRLDPALVVGRHRLGRAEPEVAQREVDGVVPLGAHQDAYAGRADEALRRDVPAGAPQHLVAGGGEAGEVRHRAAGDEADRALRPAARAGRAASVSVSSSIAEWAGVSTRRPAFWSHALTSQSTASAAGWVPPMTKPKNRPPGIAVRPGSQAAASSSTTAAGSVGPSGSAALERARPSRRSSAAAAPDGRRARRATRGRGRGRGRGRRCGRSSRQCPPAARPRTSLGPVQVLPAPSGARGPTPTRPRRRVRRAAPRPPGREGQAPGPRLPLHLLLPPPRAAAPLAPGVRGRAGGAPRSTPASRATAVDPVAGRLDRWRTSTRSARCSPSSTRC